MPKMSSSSFTTFRLWPTGEGWNGFCNLYYPAAMSRNILNGKIEITALLF